MQVINLKLESNMKEEMLEAIYGTVERLERVCHKSVTHPFFCVFLYILVES